MLSILLENWLTIAALIAMILAIGWFLNDDAIFWADAQRAARGERTRKYFTQFNKK